MLTARYVGNEVSDRSYPRTLSISLSLVKFQDVRAASKLHDERNERINYSCTPDVRTGTPRRRRRHFAAAVRESGVV